MSSQEMDGNAWDILGHASWHLLGSFWKALLQLLLWIPDWMTGWPPFLTVARKLWLQAMLQELKFSKKIWPIINTHTAHTHDLPMCLLPNLVIGVWVKIRYPKIMDG